MRIVGTLRELFAASSAADRSLAGEAGCKSEAAPRLSKWLLQASLPACCALCSDVCASAVCLPCERALTRVEVDACPRCALPSVAAQICGRCLRFPPQWRRIKATFAYEFPLDRLVVGAKHARQWGVFDWATDAAGGWPFAKDSILVPVPVARGRLAERGYNQAQLLAEGLAKRHQLRIHAQSLVRLFDSGSQAKKNWRERRQNVKNAFVATEPLSAQKIVLVDDVLTTGATLNECARVLLEAGAAEVHAWVIARASPPRTRTRIQQFNRVLV